VCVIGLGTEQLARRSGPALGGFLNATFGNAAELNIPVVALNNGHIGLLLLAVYLILAIAFYLVPAQQ
jgi:Ca2+:H+ antiporter